MTINVHSLLHLPQVVQNLGPLWCHSCFAFEAANGDLLTFFHGSQSVEKQVYIYLINMYNCNYTFRLLIMLVVCTNYLYLQKKY